MRPQRGSVVTLLTAAVTLCGCNSQLGNPQGVPPTPQTASAAAPSAEGPRVQIQALTADQLAQIVGVSVWTARYSGGPIECWLEIEEEGQKTLPPRIPDKDHLGAGSPNPPAEGTVELWWTRREDRQGGELTIHAANGSYTYGLNKDAFTFAWPSFGARSTTPGQGEVMKAVPGKPFVVVDYDATESLPPGDKKTPRRVHLKLMGRFPEPK